MAINLYKGGTTIGAISDHEVLRALAQQNARRLTAAVTPLTQNSGGTAGAGILKHAELVAVANNATNLAQKAATETALGTVKDGIAEIVAKANATALVLGIAGLTDNSGATAADGTLGAVTVAVTAAATGVVVADTDATLDALDNYLYQAFRLVNKLANAVGEAPLTSDYVMPEQATIASITVSGGTAADPGISKAAMDAVLVVYRNNIKTVADKLVAINTVAVPKVLAV